MKIWIDLTNSPHVNFFNGMIRELKHNNDVLLTCRPLANTIELLELSGFSYDIIGKHYGQSKIKKIVGFIIRILQLYVYLKKKSIDVAISHSSFYSPVVSKLLGIRSIYINDNEHAAGNKISFLFADQIMIPEFLEIRKVKSQWAQADKIISYPGLKEGIYLWYYRANAHSSVKLEKENKKKKIFIRPEPWTAQYYKGRRNFLDNLIIDVKDKCDIILLPRGAIQKNYYRQEKFVGVFVLENSISLNDIMENCDLFIGAGGTMTREAAVLGIPTISVYQDELLDVDNFLIKQGYMIHSNDLSAEFIIGFLNKNEKKSPDTELLKKGRAAYNLIKDTILAKT